DNYVGILDEFACSAVQTGAAHFGKFRSSQAFDFIKNAIEIIERFLIEEDFHVRRLRNLRRASANETYLGFFLARRRRTSASCSPLSRNVLLSWSSMSSTTWTTSACRCGGQ